MKLKSAVEYRIIKNSKLLALTLIPMLFLVMFSSAVYMLYKENTLCNSGIIFYIVGWYALATGFLSFATDFNFLSQNGLTRNEIHWSFILMLPISVVYSVLERLIYSLNCLLSKGTYHSFYGAWFNIERRNIVLDILIETVAIITLMSIGYFIATFLHRVKLIYKLLTVIIIIFGVVAEAALTDTKTLFNIPMFMIVLPDFFLGSLQGEFLLPHILASQIIISLFVLSLAHIFTLSYKANRKEKS